MKKLLLMLLLVVITAVSFAQVRAKVVLGGRHPIHHYHHRVYNRHYVPRRHYVRHRRPRSGVSIKAHL